ncbi:MAG: UDP-glucose/GDP-mannose dehydrogenase family protein [Candidatus Kerfeldbacteria bacterium]|nr:UDP-glucose/GDP-mannose dehydrogenase family protein [Candidatus Kerfeldbacteria bacterium]
MKLAVIGTGYVGLVTGTIFAELGNDVITVDIDKEKIRKLKEEGVIPIYEPGLEELVHRNAKDGRLTFTTNTGEAVRASDIIFIAVGTPSDKDGQADLQYVRAVAEEIGKHMNGSKVIVNKSTVPVGTGDIVHDIIRKYYDGEFEVVSNPEFLREGSAVQDCLHPDRVVIGSTNNGRAKSIIQELYKPLDCPIIFTDVKSAEMIKYASNSFLAASISFMNSVANICERVGADVEMVSEGMRYDKRIGKHAFVSAGAGYGGSCFPKDVKALIRIATLAKYDFSILKAVEEVNESQKQSVVDKLRSLVGDIRGKRIGVWGLAFKPKTDDMRDAVSLVVLEELTQEGAEIVAFDPVAETECAKHFPNVEYVKSAYDAVENVDVVLLLTEWDEFCQIDLAKVKSLMKSPKMVDGRNVFSPEKMRSLGFEYVSIGR